MDEFSRARLDRLVGQDNSATTPEDALALARCHLEEQGSSGSVLIIIEKSDGGTATYSSRVTLAEAVFLLESAKLALMFDPSPG